MKLFLNHFALEEHKLFVSLIPNEAMLIVSCGMVIDGSNENASAVGLGKRSRSIV